MSKAAELREALEARLNSGIRLGVDDVLIWNAARQIALPIFEADPELVERIAEVICQEHCGFENEEKVDPDLDAARAVLVAIALEDAG